MHSYNHFVVRGRLPDRYVARALIRHRSIIEEECQVTPAQVQIFAHSRVVGNLEVDAWPNRLIG